METKKVSNYYLKQDIPQFGLVKGDELIPEGDFYVFIYNSVDVSEEGSIENSGEVKLHKSYVESQEELFEPEFVNEPEANAGPEQYPEGDMEEPPTPSNKVRTLEEIEARKQELRVALANLESDGSSALDSIIENIQTQYLTLAWVTKHYNYE